MKNTEAADVLREYIRTNSPCNGLEMALQKAITALEHQPEPQPPDTVRWHFSEIAAQQCGNCGTCLSIDRHLCPACGSSDLRPIDVSEIGRKA